MTARPLRLPSAALLALALLPAAASAQPAPTPRQPPPLPGAESHLFRYLLNLAGVRPVANNELWNVNRSNMDDLVLVVIGGTNWDVGGRSLGKWLDEVPRGGGSVLFLSKTGIKFQQPWGAREQQEVDLTGHVVSAGFNTPHYANRRECPFVVPVTPDEQPFRPRNPGPIWDLFAGLDRVVTYYPSYFVTDRPGPEYRDRLARFPEGSVVSNGLTLPRNAAFARGGEGPHPDTGKPFRYVAMADQDVFTNRLLVAPETDNLLLARRTVFYLVDPPTANNPDGAGRKRCLFVENGRVISDFKAAEYIFQPPTPLPPVPPLGKIQDKIVDAGNQIIDRLETNDALNRSILGGSDPDRQERNLRNIIGVLLAVAAVFGSIMLLTRVWGKKQPLDVPNPP
ncbi:MAG: hypothetical protein K2P78_11875, partial [Gemmataceae bacterium]|nr:hypothetical protein [Gemmataceae bacterium]